MAGTQAGSSRIPHFDLVLVVVLACFVPSSDLLHTGLVSFGLLALWWPSRRRWTYGIESAKRDAALLSLALAMLTAATVGDITRLVQGEVRASNFFHYYLGAKYFAELGYEDLYVAALVADHEHDGYWSEKISEARDLGSYEIVPREQLEDGFTPGERFTAERWRSFKEDVAALAGYRRAERWSNVFRDRGYNGTPFWTSIGRASAALVPATSSWLPVLAFIDPVLLALTALLVSRTFGRRRSVLVLLLFVASPTNTARLIGGFLQADWLCAMAAGLCFYHRRRPALAGALMAYAIMTRVFPVILIAFALLPALVQGVRCRHIAPRLRRYALSCVLSCVVALAIGTANGRGPQAWLEWVEAISLHREHHVAGERRIGLEHAFTGDFRQMREKADATDRARTLEMRQPWVWTAKLLLVGMLAAAALGGRSWNAQILGLGAVFSLLVLSRYYFGAAALMPLFMVDGASRRRLLAGGQMAAFLLYGAAVLAGADWHGSYSLMNALLAVYFVGTAGLPLWRRLRASPSSDSAGESLTHVRTPAEAERLVSVPVTEGKSPPSRP
ncbi:MAG: hypothetical protein OEM62_06210 [Acidobacteriota bacterium]|nr:hypothetical protein [Acidobacteriota bacterium]